MEMYIMNFNTNPSLYSQLQGHAWCFQPLYKIEIMEICIMNFNTNPSLYSQLQGHAWCFQPPYKTEIMFVWKYAL